MKNDVLLFLLKQTAADGQVAKEEVQFINEYLGMTASVESVLRYLRQYLGALSGYKLPSTIEKLSAFYNKCAEDNDDFGKKLSVVLLDSFLVMLVALCHEIISIDGSVSDDELDGLNEIINVSSDHIEKSLGFVPDGVETARKFVYKSYE